MDRTLTQLATLNKKERVMVKRWLSEWPEGEDGSLWGHGPLAMDSVPLSMSSKDNSIMKYG
jgi:hypothetical protein